MSDNRVVRFVLIGALVTTPLVAHAQRGPELWGYATATSIRDRANFGTRSLTTSGATFGGEGGITWQYISLRAAYAQGPLSARGNESLTHDFVESHAGVGVRLLPGLELVGGIHGRAFVTTEGTQRWTFWQLRARYDTPLFTPMVRGYAELWRAASGDVDSPTIRRNDQDLLGVIRLRLGRASIADAFQSAGGGAVGIVLRPTNGPFALRLGYAIDETRLGAQDYRSTVEGLTLSVGLDGVGRFR
jgi:hypothetical protein